MRKMVNMYEEIMNLDKVPIRKWLDKIPIRKGWIKMQ